MAARFTLFAFLAFAAAPAFADEMDDALKGLEKAIKEKSKADIRHFSGIVGDRFAQAKEDQKKNALKLVKQGLSHADSEAKEACLESLSKMDGRAFDVLAPEFDKAKDSVEYQLKVVGAIGALKDVKNGLPFLRKLLNYKTVEVTAKAIDALGGYKDADLATKKDLVGDLVKLFSSVTSAAEKPKAQTSDKVKLEKTREPFQQTLTLLTGVQNVTGADQWQKWWNETGKKADKW
ncbi:MAG TPA: hypothetical protein VEI02_10040 [Planctomycetota bacterium]|nr:hypothetical protein [Planctomycetota bacterium]